MKGTQTLSHVNKLSFALDYVKAEKNYLKYKKLQNITAGIGLVLAGIVALLAGVGNITIALSVAIFGAMGILPTFFVFNSTKRYIIDNASNEQISFKQFRKMEKSGELKQLIAEINKLNKEASVTIGIPKITPQKQYTKTQAPFSSLNNLETTKNSSNEQQK